MPQSMIKGIKPTKKAAPRRSVRRATVNPLVYDIHLERAASGRLAAIKPKEPAVAGQLIRWHLRGFDRATIGPFLGGSVLLLREVATPDAHACALAVQSTNGNPTFYRISVEGGPSAAGYPRASVLYTLIITDTFPGPLGVGSVGD